MAGLDQCQSDDQHARQERHQPHVEGVLDGHQFRAGIEPAGAAELPEHGERQHKRNEGRQPCFRNMLIKIDARHGSGKIGRPAATAVARLAESDNGDAVSPN